MDYRSIVTTLKGEVTSQFGKATLSCQMPLRMLKSLFDIDGRVQRELDIRKRKMIRDFIIDCLDKDQPFYFGAFVFSARGQLHKSHNGEGFELVPGSKLYICDGQHRMRALISAMSYLSSLVEHSEEFTPNDPKIEQLRSSIEFLENYPISMQIFLDLNQKEERQLFTDMNTERSDAHAGLVMQFDQRDEYTRIARHVADQLHDTLDIEMKLSRLTVQNSAITSLAIIKRCMVAMFEGNVNAKTGLPYFKGLNPNQAADIASAFFKKWVVLFPVRMDDRQAYVCGLAGIQVALAYTVYQLTKNEKLSHLEAIDRLQTLSHYCTWRHEDPLFRDYYDPSAKKIKNYSHTTATVKLAQHFLHLMKTEEEVRI